MSKLGDMQAYLLNDNEAVFLAAILLTLIMANQ